MSCSMGDVTLQATEWFMPMNTPGEDSLLPDEEEEREGKTRRIPI